MQKLDIIALSGVVYKVTGGGPRMEFVELHKRIQLYLRECF